MLATADPVREGDADHDQLRAADRGETVCVQPDVPRATQLGARARRAVQGR